MAINFCPMQFDRDDVVELVTNTLKNSALSPHYLEVEITESILMSNIEKVAKIADALKATGVNFSIDDFSSGYSSLAASID
jgi:EAL domain-containing protein (putative c-di-GMP-specific phosphodiesterase class I)